MILSVFIHLIFVKFRFSKTVYKILVKVQDRAKKFSSPVGVGWKCVGGMLTSTDWLLIKPTYFMRVLNLAIL